MKFDKLYNKIISEQGSAFKSREDAEQYCKLIRDTGVKCKPKSLGNGYWRVEYLDNVEVSSLYLG